LRFDEGLIQDHASQKQLLRIGKPEVQNFPLLSLNLNITAS
jgi:hypothetical protein